MISPQPPKLKAVEVSLSPEGVCLIAFNRPDKLNSLNPQAYVDWRDALRWASTTKEVLVTVMTGNGRVYCAGQELAIPSSAELAGDYANRIREQLKVTKEVVELLINFPRLLIAAVNGSAIGIGCTTLALCDVVYSVPKATFFTPFMELAFCAEGCSSVMFPKIMGLAKANEVLLLGRKCTAQEFEQWGMISRIFPEETFLADVLKIARKAAKLPLQAVEQSKNLVRIAMRKELLEANDREFNCFSRDFFQTKARWPYRRS